MKKIYTVFLLLIFFFLRNTNVSAQWTSAEGMDEANCQSLVVLDSTLFACTNASGICARNIYGGDWLQKIPGEYFKKIMKAGDVLFAAGSFYNNTYRSRDHGQTWEIPGSMGSSSNVTLDTLVFFTYNNTVERSDDYGETFYPVFTTPANGSITLFGNDQTLFCWGVSQTHLYYSLNNGLTWDSLVKNGLPVYPSTRDIFNFNNEYWLANITWDSSRVYKWNNGLQSWQVNDTIPLQQFGTYNNELHACGKYGFYRHDTATNHWILLNTTTEPSNILAFCSSDSLLFCGTGSGVYRSGPSYDWEAYYDGLHQANIRSMSSLDNEVLAITPNSLFRSIDFGSHFEKLPPPYPYFPIKLAITDSHYCMISYDGFSVSVDQGNSWINYNAGLPGGLTPFDLGINSDFRFITSGHEIYRSSITPVRWDKILSDTTLSFFDLVCNDSVILVSVSRIIDGRDYYYLLRSMDDGLTFDSISVGVEDHVALESLIYTGNNFFTGFDNFLYQSMDNGITWNQVQVPDTVIYIIGITKSEGAIILSSCSWECHDNNLFITFDNGGTWTEIRGGLPEYHAPASPLLSYETRILAGVSENGLWYNDFALTGTKDIIPNKNETLKISPNPASDKITVTITADKNYLGNIRIFDLTGRTVYEGGMKEFRKGKNQIQIDIQNLNPGVYIISIIAEGKPVHGKFVKR